jgi:hypothetical protein
MMLSAIIKLWGQSFPDWVVDTFALIRNGENRRRNKGVRNFTTDHLCDPGPVVLGPYTAS